MPTPTTPGGSHDLFVSHQRIGSALLAGSAYQAALYALEKARIIVAHLTNSYPGNAEWKNELSIVVRKIDEIKQSYYGNAMDAAMRAAAEILCEVYPSEDVDEAIKYLAAKKAARETTARTPASRAGCRIGCEDRGDRGRGEKKGGWHAIRTGSPIR